MNETLVNGKVSRGGFITTKQKKEQILSRFNAAYEIAGRDWKNLVVAVNQQFNTKAGADALNRIMGDRVRGTRISLEKLEEITIALEKAIGIKDPETI